MDFTFDLRSDAVLGPVSGEDHCSQVSPSRVATQVQTAEGEKSLLKTERVLLTF